VELCRELDERGKATYLLNQKKVSRQALSEVGMELVERSLQGDSHFLRHEAAQLKLVDSALGLSARADEVRRLYTEFARLSEEERVLSEEARQLEARRDLIKYQLEEFQALKLADFERLEGEAALLGTRLKSLGTAEAVLGELAREGSPRVDESVGVALRLLRRTEGHAELEAELGLALASLSKVISELERRLEASLEDRETYERLNSELLEMKSVARKHRVTPAELGQILSKLELELQTLSQAEIRLTELGHQIQKAEAALITHAELLHDARELGLKKLEALINQNMRRLNLGESYLGLSLTRCDLGIHGVSTLTMLFRSSPNLPFAPLGQIASGGEVSRVLLALLLTTRDHAELLVLDEVDAGTGGRTATAIGETLAAEKAHAQVLCVTHSAQLASLAQRHFVLQRAASETDCRTEIRSVEGRERVMELGRMLGGTEAAERHAAELAKSASEIPEAPTPLRRLRRVA
jgi:DNA repair protein RecN (Recombination protein N)